MISPAMQALAWALQIPAFVVLLGAFRCNGAIESEYRLGRQLTRRALALGVAGFVVTLAIFAIGGAL